MSPTEAGQAAPIAVGVGALLTVLVLVVGCLGWVQVAAARAQTAADLASISGARALRSDISRLSLARGREQRQRLAAEIEAGVAEVARRSGARLKKVTLDGAGWPPVAIEVRVALTGPGGLEVSAASRAGFSVAPTGDGASSIGSGGGYAGPLVYRDGRPTCPAVAAAFDEMDAAAARDSVDLVVTSGFRSDAEQAILFARHPDPKWVARAGESRHRDATELDISIGRRTCVDLAPRKRGPLWLPAALQLGAVAFRVPRWVRRSIDGGVLRRTIDTRAGLGSDPVPSVGMARRGRRRGSRDHSRRASPSRIGL